MSRARSWDAVVSWALPSLVLAVGIFPPHVHAPLAGILAMTGVLLAVAILGAGRVPALGAGAAAPLLAAATLAGLSAAAALYPTRSVRILVVWVCGALVFSAARGLGKDGEARRAARSVILVATLLAVLGLYQSLIGFPSAAQASGRPPDAASESGAPRSASSHEEDAREAAPGATSEALMARVRSGRAVGTLGLPGLLAAILILAIPLTAAEATASRSGRALWLGALVLQVGALAATRSVAGVAGLVLATLACATGWRDRSSGARRALVVLILIGAVAALAPRLLAGGDEAASRSLGLRLANWRAAVSMIVSHPALGVGPDNYAVAFPAHRTWASNETQHAHNTYLEIVGDLGLAAIPLVAIAIAGLARSAWTSSRRADGERGRLAWRRALAVSSLAWALQALFDFTAYVAATLVPFLAVAGLLAREGSRPDAGNEGAAPAAPPAGIPTRTLILATACLAAVVAVPDAESRRHLGSAVEAVSRRDFASAVEEARRAALWNPFDAEARVVLSQALLDIALHDDPAGAARRGALEEALDEAEAAVRLDPHTANRRAALAMARAGVGDVAGAYASAAAAVRLNPFHPRYAADRDALLKMLTERRVGGQGGEGGR